MLPNLLDPGRHFIPLAALAGLLVVLLVPYTVVYMHYEEGVRRAMRQAFALQNERRLREEAGGEGRRKRKGAKAQSGGGV